MNDVTRKCESCGATTDLTYKDDDAALCKSCYAELHEEDKPCT